MSTMMIEKGRATRMAMVCRAFMPCSELPTPSMTAAMAPDSAAKVSRTRSAGFGLPPVAIIDMTYEPESEDVTKKMTRTSMARTDSQTVIGMLSKVWNRAMSALIVPSGPMKFLWPNICW